LPDHCCQPAVAGGVIYADLWSELSTHVVPQALFTYSSPGSTATATSFPLSKHTGGGDTAPAFSGLRVYLQLMWEVGLPPSPVEFSSHRHFYKLSRSWLLGMCPRSWLLRPGLLWGISSPHPSSVPHPLYYVSFFLLLLIIQFLFFPWWWSVCPGGYADLAQSCLWKYCVPLSSPCLHLPKPSGCCCLAAWGLSWIFCLTWSGDAMRRLEVWRNHVLPLPSGFSCKVCLQCLSKILL
jgi:hypothetical protein